MAEAANVQARAFARAVIPEYQLAWVIAATFAAAYLLLIGQLSSLPMQDMPNHLARAIVMADLMFHGGARFGDAFQYQFMAIPYVLPDIAFAVLVEALGPTRAGVAWNILSFASVPAALMFYTRVLRCSQDERAFVLLLGLYLGADWFFLMGFVGFRFAIALTIVGLGLAQLLRERWSWPLFGSLGLVIVSGYFTHLCTILFLGISIGVTGFFRFLRGRTTLKTEALLLSPLALMVAWHVVGASVYNDPGYESINKYRWGSILGKIRGMWEHWARFSIRTDLVLLSVVAFSLVWPLRQRLRWESLRHVAVLEMLALFLMLVVMYWVLPFSYSEATYVEDRPLGLMIPVLLIAFLSLPARPGEPHPVFPTSILALMSLVLVINLVALGKHLLKDEDQLDRYREIVAAVPRGATVLPINTTPKDGRVSPWLHAGAYVTIDRAGIVPILFAANRGDAMKYFRYIDKPFAPKESWYLDSSENVIDWEAVACDYQYVLISKPFEAERIPFAPFVVAENDDAALLSVNRSGCPGALRRAVASKD